MILKSYIKIDSTNLEAKRLINLGKIFNNTVLVAKIQTLGIGRLNRQWISHKGGLWFTIIFPNENFNSSVSIFTGIMLHKILLNSFPNAALMIKWPNDIFWKNKKLAGILCSNHSNSSIIGVGVNINQKRLPEEINELATSVYIESNKRVKIGKLLHKFLHIFEENLPTYKKEDIKFLLSYYQKYDYLYGKNILISIPENEFKGKATGISENGELIMRTDNKEKRFLSADKIDILNDSEKF